MPSKSPNPSRSGLSGPTGYYFRFQLNTIKLFELILIGSQESLPRPFENTIEGINNIVGILHTSRSTPAEGPSACRCSTALHMHARARACMRTDIHERACMYVRTQTYIAWSADLRDEKHIPTNPEKRAANRYGPINKPDVLAKWFRSAYAPKEDVRSTRRSPAHLRGCGDGGSCVGR